MMVRLGDFIRIYDRTYDFLYISKTLFKVVDVFISDILIVEVDPIKNAADIDVIRGWHPGEKFHSNWETIYTRLKKGQLYWYVYDYEKISNLISNE